MSDSFKQEAAEYYLEINVHKAQLSNIFGFDDSVVKGFDMEEGAEGYDEGIDKLDIYAKFLGENEYLKMKENYNKALDTMTQLLNMEKERMAMNSPVNYNDLVEKYGHEIL